MKTSLASVFQICLPLISSAEASPVRTLAAPGLGLVSPELSRDFGTSTDESSENCAPDSSSSRTSPPARRYGFQPLEKISADSNTESVPLRFLPSMSEPRTYGAASSSSLLPTPTASSYGSNRGGANAKETGAPAEIARHSPMLGTMAFHGLLATATATANQLSPSMAKWPGCAAWQVVHPRGPLLPSFVEWLMGFPDGWTG